MKPQSVIPSGSNQFTEQPCCSTAKYYAYASTLSIYIYRSEDMQLERIINYPEHTINCIAGNPTIDKVSAHRGQFSAPTHSGFFLFSKEVIIFPSTSGSRALLSACVCVCVCLCLRVWKLKSFFVFPVTCGNTFCDN